MRFRYGAVALPIVAWSAFALAGCNASNEDNLGGQTSQVAPPKAGMEHLKSYGDAMKYQAEQAAKNRAAKGKVGSVPKSSEPSKPEPGKEQPKSP
jgi:hypothetical protein